MKNCALGLVLLVLSLLCTTRALAATELSDQTMDSLFKGYKGSFVLLDLEKKQYTRYHAEDCAKRYPPCSTFKIFNSLAGLDCGVLTGPDHLMKWDGQKRMIEAWNQDHTLQSAIKESAVWYFQRVAEAIGKERMQQYLHKVGYGNEDISAGLTTFWLGSSLKISADEQVEFLRRLYTGELPFSASAMDTVKKLIIVDETPAGVLRGKTGSNYENEKWILGWFVGYVVHDGKPYIFATRIEAADNAKGAEARRITKQILHQAGLY